MTSVKSIARRASDEAAIRGLIDEWAEAIRAKDVEASLAHYAPDVLIFDVVGPLRFVGSDAGRERLEQWLSSFEGPIDYENRDLSIVTGAEVAFCHSLNHVGATTTDGTRIDMYWRATVCLRRIGGDWTVTHTHSSVPFDAETGRAALDLEP
jgi:uncharacterized protein (TIGR02246 family)